MPAPEQRPEDSPEHSHTVDCQGLALHVRQRHPEGSPAVLLLHGWLDHSHGFDPLLAHLPAPWRLLLLDFRGMGQSAHVPRGGHYHFSDYLLDVDTTLGALGVAEVHLVGHSLGGIVGAAYAAARPERVRSLTLIESLGPSGGEPEAAVARLRGFLDDCARPPHSRRYPSVEAAAQRLREANSSLTPEAARLLARHGTRPVEGGVVFGFDPLHRRRFGSGFDEAQWLAVLRAVACPVRVLHGSHGFTFEDAQARARLDALRAPPPLCLPGGHHVHLEQPEAVARALVELIG